MSDNRFPKRERLKSRSDIERIFERNRTYADDAYRVLAAANGRDFSRMAVVVRRTLGNAVARNREKRFVREIYRKARAAVVRGYDFVIIVRKRAERDFSDRADSLTSILRRFT